MKLKQLVDRMMVYLQRRGGRVAEGAPLLREYAVYPVSRVRIPLSPPIKKTVLFCLILGKWVWKTD